MGVCTSYLLMLEWGKCQYIDGLKGTEEKKER